MPQRTESRAGDRQDQAVDGGARRLTPRRRDHAAGALRAEAAATLAIAAPVALASLSQMAMGVTDTVMLGGLGPAALAAGGLGSAVFFSAVFALQGTLSAVGVLAARARGAAGAATGAGGGELGAIPAAYWSGMAIAVVLSALAFAVASYPGVPLRWSGTPDAVIADCAAYLGVLRWGAPAALVGLGLLRATLPAIGQQRLLLWVVPATAVLNAILNRWLIHGGLGVPPLGIRGSAAATAATLWIGAAALLLLLHGRRSLRAHVWPPRVRARVSVELLSIGLPVSGMILLEATMFLATDVMAAEFGADTLAAHIIALSVASTAFMVPLSIGQAANVRVATEAGAGRPAAARRAGLVALALGAAAMALSAAAMVLVPEPIVGFYLNPLSGPATAAIAVSLLRISAMFQLADGTQAVAAGALRGLKDTRVPALCALLGYWVIGLWSGRFLALDYGLGPRGLWFGLFAGLAVTALCLTVRFCLLTRPGGRTGRLRPPSAAA